MSWNQVVLRVPITELPMIVEQKSKQMALNDKPEPMSLTRRLKRQTRTDVITH